MGWRVPWLAVLLGLGGCTGGVVARPVTLCDASARETQPLSAQFLGASTLTIDDGATVVMIDGFFSRPSALKMLFWPLKPDHTRIDAALARANIQRVNAVFVAHSHYDHVLDTAEVANRTCAEIYGSPSTRNVVLSQTINSVRVKDMGNKKSYPIGSMTVTVYSTEHSKPVRFSGKVSQKFRLPAHAFAFREGGSFSFHIQHKDRSILIVPSANLENYSFAGVKADIVFLGVGGLGVQDKTTIHDYWNRSVEAVCARVVVPIHWDDFTRSLSRPLRRLPWPLDDYAATLKVFRPLAESRNVSIIEPDAFERFDLGDASRLFAMEEGSGCTASAMITR